MNTQHEALELAEILTWTTVESDKEKAAEFLRQQHALIVKMAVALEQCASWLPSTEPRYVREDITKAIAAAKDYLK